MTKFFPLIKDSRTIWGKLSHGLAWLVLAVVAAFAIIPLLGHHRYSDARDYYHYWAVSFVRQAEDPDLRRWVPYGQERHYETILNWVADHTDDPRLNAANRYRRNTVQLVATPFLFSVTSILPLENYYWSFAVFFWLKAFLFLVSIFWLSRHVGLPLLGAAGLSVGLWILCRPMIDDLTNGNLNIVQLAIICLIYMLMVRQTSARGPGMDLVLPWLAGSLTLCLVALKPNVVWLIPLMALYYLKTLGFRKVIRALTWLLVPGTLILAWPIWRFGDLGIWLRWLEVIGQVGPDGRPVMMHQGPNWAFANYLFSKWGVPVPVSLSSVAALFLAIFAIVGVGRSRRCAQSWGGGVLDLAGRVLNNPGVVISLAILLSLSLSVLIWSHYLVFLLFPALILTSFRAPMARMTGWATVFMATNYWLVLLNGVPWGADLVRVISFLTWAIAWGALIWGVHADSSCPAGQEKIGLTPAPSELNREG